MMMIVGVLDFTALFKLYEGNWTNDDDLHNYKT